LKTVQHDLAEFGQAIKDDTEEVVETVKTKAPELQEKLVNQDLPQFQHKSEEVAEDVRRGFSAVGSQLATFSKSVVTGISEISTQVQEAVQMEMETKKQKKVRERKPRAARDTTSVGTNGKYSRYESQVSAMQRDSGTYCDEPTDLEDFAKWQETFDFQKHESAIEEVLKDDAFMQELQSRIVPLIVDKQTFWTRYFYRLAKLQEQHNQREQLVQRAHKGEQEEELSWDVEEADTDTVQTTNTESPEVETVSPKAEVESKGTPEDAPPAVNIAESSARLAEMRIAEPAEEVESDTTADSGDSFIIVKKNAEKTPSPKVAPSEEATIPVSDETAESTPKPTSTPAVAAGPIEKKEPPQKHVESVAPALPVAVANASASTISPAIVEPKPVPIAKNEELDEDWGDDLDEDWGADG